MITKISWKEFQTSGFLWFVNHILHTFGLAIVFEIPDDGKVLDVYPARVMFRGFVREAEDEGFRRVSQYMKKNAKELLKETK